MKYGNILVAAAITIAICTNNININSINILNYSLTTNNNSRDVSRNNSNNSNKITNVIMVLLI